MVTMIGASGTTVDGSRLKVSDRQFEIAMQEADTLRIALNPAPNRAVEHAATLDHVPQPGLNSFPAPRM